jgi:hypothetical protein
VELICNFYIPFRSKAYGLNTAIANLTHNRYINFYETDTILPEHNAWVSLFRYDITNTKKLITNSVKYNKFNASIVNGYSIYHLIQNEKIDNFLIKHSAFNYTCVDKLALPLCFPRLDNKEIQMKDLSLLTNNRPFFDFSNKIPQLYKQFDIPIRKYLNYIDSGKFIESKDKLEDIYSILYLYKRFIEDSDEEIYN